jgi:hypothetical protein
VVEVVDGIGAVVQSPGLGCRDHPAICLPTDLAALG